MTDEQIKHMRDRFLFWKLPADFRPDCGIHFDADAAKKLHPQNHRYEPQGTNLFDATQADAMVRHMIEGIPTTEQPSEMEWTPLAKALFHLEHDPKIKDQAWFDFQGKAQLILRTIQQQKS